MIQLPCGQAIGVYGGGTGTSTQNQALSTATTLIAFGFKAPISDTLSTFRFFINTVTGSVGATDTQISLYSDTPGTPGTSIASTTNIGGSPPTSGNWFTATFASPPSLTFGTQYWIVLQNLNGTPSSNNITVRALVNALNQPWFGVTSSVTAASGLTMLKSTNGGTSWINEGGLCASYRIGFGGGGFFGFPFFSCANAGTSQRSFAGVEAGFKWTLPGPSSLLYNVAGVSMPIFANGSPTGSLCYRLYVGNSQTTFNAQTNNFGGANPPNNTSNWVDLLFSSVQQIAGGSVIRLTMFDNGGTGDTSTNSWGCPAMLTGDTDSNSLPLYPFEGTAQASVLSGQGGSWTDYQSSGLMPQGALLLATNGEFSVSGGGGGGAPPRILNAPQWIDPERNYVM